MEDAFFWTVGYDTIYAFQDRGDDLKIGIKSSAMIVHNYGKSFIYFCYGGFSLSLIGVAFLSKASWWIYAMIFWVNNVYY